jgi:hypothetical protein
MYFKMKMKQLIRKTYDHRLMGSWASQLRQKRFNLLKSLIYQLPKPIKILDVGGKSQFWENMEFLGQEIHDIEITLLNMTMEEIGTLHPKLKYVIGDARNMTQFYAKEFDVVFSNSVIEHVGDLADQAKMAKEISRVGKCYFIQTPSFHFPIEPHFLFPCFHWFPISIRTWLVMHFSLGWYGQVKDKCGAIELVNSIQLLRKQEIIQIFPQSILYEEKFLGLSKSFIVREGWPADQQKSPLSTNQKQ